MVNGTGRRSADPASYHADPARPLMREQFGWEYHGVGGVDDREGRPREPGRPYVLEEQMRHTILMAGISMLAISGSALAASPIPPDSADLAAPNDQLAQVQVQVPAAQPSPSATIVTTPSSPSAGVVRTPGSQPSVVTTTPSANPASTTVVVAPTAPPPPQAENPPRRLAPAMSGPKGTGGGTARNTYGSPAAMSCRQQRSRAGPRDIGNRVPTAGFGSTAAGTKPPRTGSDGRPGPDFFRNLSGEELAVFEIAGEGADLDHGLAAQHDE
jgi:hypothetical protein